MEIALGLLILLAQNPVGRGEFSHDEAASAKVANKTAEDRVSDTSHWCENSGGRDGDIAQHQAGRDGRGPSGQARVDFYRTVPELAHRTILLLLVWPSWNNSFAQVACMDSPGFTF